jgi:polysaccharide pyruvyl transferase CsaB
MLASLRARRPDAALTVFSRDAAHTAANHDVDSAVAVREINRQEALEHVERLDLLLLGGGGILYDGEAGYYLREVQLAQRAGVPTMAFGIGAGPLSSAEDCRLVREVLGAMQIVTVRDAGAKRLLERIDVESPVEVTADPALLLACEPFPAERLREEGIGARRALVGMSLRERGPAAPDLDAAGYHSVLAHTADFVAARFDAEIVFVPMELGDIRLAHAVIARMECADRAHVLTGHYRPGELLGLMEHLDMVIAMRLHVLIFAALKGTPLFPLPYAAKVADFIRALGLPPPVAVTGDSTGALLAAVDRAWDLRGADATRLREAVERLRDRARLTLDRALACLPPALTTIEAAG